MTLGEKIRHLRDESQLTQREVGDLIGLDGTYISQVELNKKLLKRGHLQSLALLFKISQNDLDTLWLSDKVFRLIEKEKNAGECIKNVLKRLNQ